MARKTPDFLEGKRDRHASLLISVSGRQARQAHVVRGTFAVLIRFPLPFPKAVSSLPLQCQGEVFAEHLNPPFNVQARHFSTFVSPIV